MHVVSQSGKIIVRMEYANYYGIAVKSDAVSVVAWRYGGQAVTMGRYKDEKEACRALGDLCAAIVGGQTSFDMPESLLFSKERIVKKRKGGS